MRPQRAEQSLIGDERWRSGRGDDLGEHRDRPCGWSALRACPGALPRPPRPTA